MATKKFLGASTIKFLGASTLKFIDAAAGGQTATPSIENASGFFNGVNFSYDWSVRNNDALSATIFSELGDSTPDINQGVVASNGTVFPSATAPLGLATVYATAQASGKTLSELASAFIDAGGGS